MPISRLCGRSPVAVAGGASCLGKTPIPLQAGALHALSLSYAYVGDDGKIRRFHQVIGSIDDLVLIPVRRGPDQAGGSKK
jgi:hypothetical protein